MLGMLSSGYLPYFQEGTMNSYVSLDLETTGLNPKLDKIIEIGAVKVINGEVVDNFSEFLHPGRKLEEKTIELTGITEEDLCNAPEAAEVIPRLLDFCEDLPLVGHRILFDYSFVKHAAVNLGLSFEKEGVDTLKISRACHPELESKKLSAMCEHYGIPLQAHRAYNDAQATAKLFECLKKNFSEKYPESFEPVKLVYQIKRESPIRPLQITKLKKLIELHKIECPYEIEKMTRNEASRYIDKILAKYGK